MPIRLIKSQNAQNKEAYMTKIILIALMISTTLSVYAKKDIKGGKTLSRNALVAGPKHPGTGAVLYSICKDEHGHHLPCHACAGGTPINAEGMYTMQCVPR